MNKSTSIIFSFLFFFLVLGASATVGGVFGFNETSGTQILDGAGKKKVENGDDSKLEEKEKSFLFGAKSKEVGRELEDSKPMNVGIELTKALFGKYLKKEE